MSIDTMELDTAGKVAAIPIDEIDVARPSLFQQDTIGLYFDRLRKEEPVHYCRESYVGPYWSITKFDDIMAVDTNHKRSEEHTSELQSLMSISYAVFCLKNNIINIHYLFKNN